MTAATPKTICVVDGFAAFRHATAMLGTQQLLATLEARGVSQAEMARVLNLPSSRISEMYAGKRQIKLDEAKRLVEAFDLDDANPMPLPMPPMPPPMPPLVPPMPMPMPMPMPLPVPPMPPPMPPPVPPPVPPLPLPAVA
jgi:hypothetical protein